MKRELIAQVAHDLNRAYCASLGDDSQPVWAEAPEWQQQSALAGVDMHLANPDATPAQSHESWLAQKLADGWVYGEVKDAEKKQHPCCVPYDQLPAEQKAKDYIFRATVHALKDLPDAEDAVQAYIESLPPAIEAAAEVAPQDIPDGYVAVQYVGQRPTFTDRVYGTGLDFVSKQARWLPPDVAKKLLRHPDQFALAKPKAAKAAKVDSDTNALLDAASKQAAEQQAALENLQQLRDQVMVMDVAGLANFASTNYRQTLDQKLPVEALRQQVIGFVDQFGAV